VRHLHLSLPQALGHPAARIKSAQFGDRLIKYNRSADVEEDTCRGLAVSQNDRCAVGPDHAQLSQCRFCALS
jgi:hypothetical protein